VSQLFRHGENDREINLFVGHAARTSNSTCAGCATIRRLMKCPGRVILRRHNGASSGSTRIISLGCVRAANNSLLFPVPGTDDASLMTTGKEEDHRNVRSFISHSFTSCRVRLPWTRMHPHASCGTSHERSDTSISSPESCDVLRDLAIVFVPEDHRRISYAEEYNRDALRDAYDDRSSFISILQITITKTRQVL